jgi:hypothetical protein
MKYILQSLGTFITCWVLIFTCSAMGLKYSGTSGALLIIMVLNTAFFSITLGYLIYLKDLLKNR